MTTYPHLVGLFNELGIDSDASDMSFSLSTDTVEWGSRGLGAVFAQKKNAISADFLLMIREIVRFGKEAPEVLKESPRSRHAEFSWMTLGQYLTRRGYSRFFTENYVVPMCAAIWSCSDRDALDFPVVTLVRFWVNHHLLNLVERPLWRVVRGRSEAYVDAIVAAITKEDFHFHGRRRGVVELKRKPYGVAVYSTRGESAEENTKGESVIKREYDDVIFACHSDQALAILGEEAKDAERAALDAIKFQVRPMHTCVLFFTRPSVSTHT
jgi:predicted NAD/FAD-binding protein